MHIKKHKQLTTVRVLLKLWYSIYFRMNTHITYIQYIYDIYIYICKRYHEICRFLFAAKKQRTNPNVTHTCKVKWDIKWIVIVSGNSGTTQFRTLVFWLRNRSPFFRHTSPIVSWTRVLLRFPPNKFQQQTHPSIDLANTINIFSISSQ